MSLLYSFMHNDHESIVVSNTTQGSVIMPVAPLIVEVVFCNLCSYNNSRRRNLSSCPYDERGNLHVSVFPRIFF